MGRGRIEWCLGAPTVTRVFGPARRGVVHDIDGKVGFKVYAIVRAGGRQEKVSVGDVLIVDKVNAEPGASVELTPLLLVDGENVTTQADDLAKVTVTAEVVKATKGPKITILKHKSKTGYRKRQGHRQPTTQIKVTAISA